MEYWQSVKDTGDADQLLAYIKKYPEGRFVELAESRLKGLTSPQGQTGSQVKAPVAAPTIVPPPAGQAGKTSVRKKQGRISTNESTLQVIRRSLGRYSNNRLHVYPNIPRTKADNAASVHGMDPRSILLLYDDGLGGGGKTGFAVTDERVYWRYVSGAQPYYLDFRQIQTAIARNNKFLLNGYDVPTTMSGDTRQAAEVYSDLMINLSNSAP